MPLGDTVGFRRRSLLMCVKCALLWMHARTESELQSRGNLNACVYFSLWFNIFADIFSRRLLRLPRTTLWLESFDFFFGLPKKCLCRHWHASSSRKSGVPWKCSSCGLVYTLHNLGTIWAQFVFKCVRSYLLRHSASVNVQCPRPHSVSWWCKCRWQ